MAELAGGASAASVDTAGVPTGVAKDMAGHGAQPRMVLASSSPSRLAVLRSAGIEPLVLVPGVDEEAIIAKLRERAGHSDSVESAETPGLLGTSETPGPLGTPRAAEATGAAETPGEPTPAEIVRQLAEAKALAVTEQFSDRIPAGAVVVAGDSMLLLDGELQGKPHTVERTVERWRRQRGHSATLITGHAVVRAEPGHCFSPVVSETSSTIVHFADASDRDIAAYAATGEPLACAGAFTLEALGGWFIDWIEGDPSSVIGLSLPVVRRAVEGFSLSISDFWNR